MAYARQDPILGSLSDLRDSLRSATSDALSRRRLDLQETTLLGELESQRELAGLRRQRQEQEGETTLLKTQHDINLQKAQEARAEKRDVREEAQHGLAMETGQFSLTRAKTILPEEIAGMRSDRAYKGALAAEAGVRRQLSAFQLSRAKEEQALQNQPLPASEVNQFLESTNPAAASLFRSIVGPGEQITGRQLGYGLGIIKTFYTSEFDQMALTGIDQRLSDPNTPPEQRLALEQQRRQTMERLGKRSVSGDEQLEAVVADQILTLTKTNDPAAKESIARDLQMNMSILGAMRAKGGGRPKTAADFFRDKPGSWEVLIDKLRNDIQVRQGFMLGSVDDFLLDQNQLEPRPNYVTPNELYPSVAPQIKPATSEEWAAYRKQDPAIDTQQKADQMKRNLEVQAIHERTQGDRATIRRLLGMDQPTGPRGTSLEGALSQPSAPPAAVTPSQAQPLSSVRPQTPSETLPATPTPEELRAAATAQLQQELGREPLPREVDQLVRQLEIKIRAASRLGTITGPLSYLGRQFTGRQTPEELERMGVVPAAPTAPTPETEGLSPEQRERVRQLMQRTIPSR